MTSELEKYYVPARRGSLACVRRTDPMCGDRYYFTRILDAASGRIETAYGKFWAVNGERIDKRWHGDDQRLVLPTIARVELEEANLSRLCHVEAERKFELAAARAVLERRAARMPNRPPQRVPSLKEAEIELRDATTHWMNIDKSLNSPDNSPRARREASERLAAAKRNFQIASDVNRGTN